MNYFRFTLSTLVILLLNMSSALADYADTVAKVKTSIVAIGTYEPLGKPKAQVLGTGFAVSDELIATNAHVVPELIDQKKTKLIIYVGSGRQTKAMPAKVVALDKAHDLALLKVVGHQLPSVRLSAKTVREGEIYLFTGYPIGSALGLYPATHRAMIASISPIALPAESARHLSPARLKHLRNPYLIYQMDGTAYPGNSGSPVYDTQTGEVVAIVNKVFVKKSRETAIQDPSGITFSIPVTYLIQLIETTQN